MDSRTRRKLTAQVLAMAHLIQRHYSALAAGKSYADILSEGIGAAMTLGMVEVQREARFPRPALEFVVDEMPMPPLAPETWGLGMRLPRGDM